MNIEIKIPSPGESITEVELSAWLVKENEYVFTDQDIAEIESEKATLTLSATESGTITFISKECDTIDVGSIACTIDTSATKPENIEKPSVNQEAKTIEKNIEIEKEPVTQSSSSESSEVKLTPLAKKIMTEQDLSIEDILNGLKRIGKREVEIASGNLQNYSTREEPTTRDVEREKISLLRKNLSKRLVAVKNETAMLTTFNEVDMTNIMNLRKSYQAKFVEKYGIKLGFMSLFTKAVTLALKDHPRVNSYIDGNELVTPNFVDIGIAVQTKKGLMVPVVRDTDKLSIDEIEVEIKRLADAGRNNKITIQELQGGTFSITNGGIFGSMLSTPILNPPQSGILGMHNIIERPIAVNGKVEIRSMMYLALSYDHRVIDGKDSVGFLLKVKKYIENPDAMLIQQVDTNAALLGL